MQWSLRLTEPDIGIEEIEAVTRVLKSGWLTMGPVTKEFEQEFASKMGVKHAFAVSNCTAALHLAYIAIGVREGDEVICPALTFIATANAARYTGANVVFADVVSPDDLTVDPKDIERKISPRTKAIAVMHYGGFPCAMEDILAIAKQHSLAVVEDCAHAPFSWLLSDDGRKRYVGTLGDAGCFSFFGNKNMSTGEGGMVTTNDDAIANKIKLLRSHGLTTLTYDRDRGHAGEYDAIALGYNYRLDEIRSALGLCQLAKIDELNQKRRNVYRWYCEALTGIPHILVPFATRSLEQSACHLMEILIRKQLYGAVTAELRRRGIQTSRHYQLLPHLSLYRDNTAVYSTTCDAWDLLTLPLGPRIRRDQVEAVAASIREVTQPLADRARLAASPLPSV